MSAATQLFGDLSYQHGLKAKATADALWAFMRDAAARNAEDDSWFTATVQNGQVLLQREDGARLVIELSLYVEATIGAMVDATFGLPDAQEDGPSYIATPFANGAQRQDYTGQHLPGRRVDSPQARHDARSADARARGWGRR